jgi:hypothetical protein
MPGLKPGLYNGKDTVLQLATLDFSDGIIACASG